jgi:hypothetical protein
LGIELTALEDAYHVLNVVGLGELSAQGLCVQHLALAHGLVPVEVLLEGLGLLLGRGRAPAAASATTLLDGAEAEAAGDTVAAAALGRRGGVQGAPPGEALFAVVDARGTVDGYVDLDHAGSRLEADLRRRRSRVLVGAVGLLQDEQAAAEGQ